jgi:hypothetical protein
MNSSSTTIDNIPSITRTSYKQLTLTIPLP